MTASGGTVSVQVTCTGCPLVCDDILLQQASAQGAAEPRFQQACPSGQAWLEEAWRASHAGSGATVDGQDVTTEAALESAARRLLQARRVLVTGFGDATLETVMAAADVAERLAAAVDGGGIEGAAVVGSVVGRVGRVTADFEELRDRADCVLLWFVDPTASHPRFVERFLTPTVHDRPRRVIVVGPDPLCVPSGHAWEHLSLPSCEAAEAAASLELLLREEPAEGASVTASRLPPQWRQLTERLAGLVAACRQADCIAVVSGGNPTERPASTAASFAEASGIASLCLSRCVAWLAHRKPAFEIPLSSGTASGNGHAASAAAVCTWRYGGPAAIATACRDGSALRPAEGDARRLIERQEVDGVLVIGGMHPRLAATLTGHAGMLVQLGGEPLAVSGASVWIAAAAPSLSSGGHLLRDDGRLVRMPPLRTATRASLDDLLRQLLARLETLVEQQTDGLQDEVPA